MSLKSVINQYRAELPLEQASTPPSSWYTDPRIAILERDTVFSNNWIIKITLLRPTTDTAYNHARLVAVGKLLKRFELGTRRCITGYIPT